MPALIFYRKEFHVKKILYLFLLCFGLFFTTSSASALELPTYPESNARQPYVAYWVYQALDVTYLYEVRSAVELDIFTIGGTIEITTASDGYGIWLHSLDNGAWKQISYDSNSYKETYTATFQYNTDYHLVASTFDWINADGSNFFPPVETTPLHLVPAKIMGEQQTNLMTQVSGTMKTLTLCGVGCLALLMALSLFGKLSYLFPKQ